MPSTDQDRRRELAHRVIPAGCHTYSKCDDQFPSNAPAFLVSGDGCRTTDPDGRTFVDWGMGLRSVILGHAYPRVLEAVRDELGRGANFTRPSLLEAEVAEELIDLIPAAEMVKFAKNGSDVTTAAVRLARAATGRPLVAFPREHPFYSVDDWFIGTTAVDAGVPDETKRLSLTFTYGDRAALDELFAQHSDGIACVIMEAATDTPPPDGYLEHVREITQRHGAVLIFDEMITGFRWHLRGAQHYFGVTPDMATFGKALANGFAVSALVGRRDLLELGGLHHKRPRVFLLSTTHGGETHALAACQATLRELREAAVLDHLWRVGGMLQDVLRAAADEAGVGEIVDVRGFPCSPIVAFADHGCASAAALRTLFLQETVAREILIPYVAPSFSHGEAEVEATAAAAREAFAQVRRVMDGEPIGDLLQGPVVKPVFRRFNAVDLDA